MSISANGYIKRVAVAGFIRETERESINRSISALKMKIRRHFGATILTSSVKNHFPFGSYTRRTNLPRTMDLRSDIDYMLVFTESDVKPQAYLDRLRRFVEQQYPRSEIAQSHPTIVLSLNHIRFELVPAIENFWGTLMIPGKRGGYQDWIATDPIGFNERLTEKNKANENQIKPLIRVVKYWNALNRYPYESFELENLIVDHTPFRFLLGGGDLWSRFCIFMDSLSAGWSEPAYKRDAIERAQGLIQEINRAESQGTDGRPWRSLNVFCPR